MSHVGKPTCLEEAEDAMEEYIDCMLEGALMVLGRACVALMRAFRG